jgi:hypothetical protein
LSRFSGSRILRRVPDFVDPRTNPGPPPGVGRQPAAHGEELVDFVRLCSTGRVYDAERWVREGRPIQALTYRREKKPTILSPIRAAIRENNPDLVLLLLCNGYRLDLESDHDGSVLDEALVIRAFEILELLLKWGAEPTNVRTENVVDTYKTDLIDRFWKAGVDYTDDPAFVPYLVHTVNKPLYGWLRRNRSDSRLQDSLDIALIEAVTEDREKVVHLLIWSGADPHRKVPSLRELDSPDAWNPEGLNSSAETAISYGRHSLWKVLRVAAMPGLEAQAARAHDSRTLKAVVELSPPPDWSPVILWFIWKMCVRFSSSSWDSQDALRFVESRGGMLTAIGAEQVGHLRRQLLDLRDQPDFLWLLKWLKKPKNCDPVLFNQLTATPAMRRKIAAFGAGERYLTSQKVSRTNEGRRQAKEHNKESASRGREPAS